MTGKPKAPAALEQVAREFAARVVQTAKHRDPKAEAAREQREAAVSKALVEHLARRARPPQPPRGRTATRKQK